ncbi:MAG TPA: pseudaminic acid biosynthesis-associated methylase [Vicinamibacterales bacterium]|nr:pseudaminic acid biosynthesis-associated methylase [Vicinamibacterales bacterium]
MSSPNPSDVRRLEDLWAGDFGNAYIDRNIHAGDSRQPFWEAIVGEFPAKRVLEVGCNTGANLRWLVGRVPEVFGVDVNQKALMHVRRDLSEVNAVQTHARELPFRDQWFDLVFTTGVLIHQSPQSLPIVMSEIVRCSSRYVLCGEYHADQLTEVPYRGQTGALYKRDFGALYQELFPELLLRKTGFLGKDQGWDDVTWWMFEKAGA